ncbi:MAG: SufD family Fe-S cluster assembly protein [Candidatus Egerieousia sp.]|nr:SufD family Fe-S cluster assembly protein [Candidatus Egerieousia sp.]
MEKIIEHIAAGHCRIAFGKNEVQEKLLRLDSAAIAGSAGAGECSGECSGAGAGECSAAEARVEILCGEGSQAHLLFELGAKSELGAKPELGTEPALSAQSGAPKTKMEVKLERGALLRLDVVQETSLHLVVHLEGDSTLYFGSFSVGGSLIENDYEIDFDAPHSEAHLGGVYITSGTERFSTNVNVNHNHGDTLSNQLFKGILSGSSVARFQGRITVLKDAQKTKAYQANNNLLISPDARAYTRPHLVINADDVQCSHGATVGSLSQDELFYMRSRGISLQEAQLLQQQAFVHEVTDRLLTAEAQEIILPLLEDALRNRL